MKLDINDIARSLDLPVSTLDRWIRQGRIPVQKSGPNLSFDTQVLKKWAAARNLPFALPGDGQPAAGKDTTPETLLSAMRRGEVHTGIAGEDVDAVLAAAAACVPGLADTQKRELHTTLIEREALTSTGMGKGVAIPHPRTPLAAGLEKPMIATCYLQAPIDFNAIDARPVFVLFLLLSTSVKIHLHLLSKLAFCIRDDKFISFLKGAPPADQLFSKITELENRLDKSEIL
jgi:PTS system nitrogen regulatory IIA component